MARPAGPPDRRTAGPRTRTPGQMARNRQPSVTFSPTGFRHAPTTPASAPPPDPTTRLADTTASDLAQRPTRGEKPTAQRHLLAGPAGARPGSPATVARNRQPGVTFSPTQPAPDLAHRPQWRETDSPRHFVVSQPRPTWLTGHSGEKPTAQRHFVVSPAAPDLAHRPQWRETDSPASLCRQPSARRKPPAPVPVLAERGPDLVAADPVRNKLHRPASAVRRSVGAAHPASAATRRSALAHIAPGHTRQRECQPNRPQPPERHLAPAPPPHFALAHIAPGHTRHADANPTGRSRPAAPRTPRPGDHGDMPLRHSAGRTARRRPPDPGQFERQISSPW